MATADDFLESHQLEDFRSSFKGSGFSIGDFTLVQQRAQPTGAVYDPQAGKVTVRCKVTGIEKTYQLQSGNSWPADFSDDLRRGVFGRPKS